MNRNKNHKQKIAKNRNFKEYLKFLIAAVMILILVDVFIWGKERPYLTLIKKNYYAEQAALEQAEQEKQAAFEALLPPQIVFPEDGAEYFESPPEAPKEDIEEIIEEPEITLYPEPEYKSAPIIEEPVEAKPVVKAVQIPPKPYILPTGARPKIAIVIDDVGMNVSQSKAAMALPKAVTLAFLPYANNVATMAAQASAKGHEIIIHTPMEPMNSTVSLGGMGLTTDMDYATFTAEFEKIADSFSGYVGVNNHMGSKLTQDAEAMGFLMDQLKARGLYFLDSKTIHTSVAADMARAYGVRVAERDVFLDHEETRAFTDNALAKLERVAAQKGSAIAIGHPKEITMQALREWIPTLDAKGFELVPLSAVLEEE